MKELFEVDLTPDEQKVLQVMSEQKSYKRIAQEKGMSLERYKEAKKSLKHKLKL
jgi:DNA-binding CsgD family transcriptional regulator